MSIELESSVIGAHFGDRVRAIAEVVAAEDRLMFVTEIAEKAEIPQQFAYVYCRRMVKYGILDNPARGRYRLHPGVTDLTARHGQGRTGI